MAEVSEKKRYILFSKEDGRPDSEKPCAFFNSAAGCRNGAKCKFMHGVVPAAAPAPKEDIRKERKEKKERKEAPIPTPQFVAPVPEPKKERKEKKVPAPVSAPSAPAPAAGISEQEKLVRDLQQQLLAQQSMFEAQMKLLQQQQQQQVRAQHTQQVKPELPKKENKRKTDQLAVPNKSPKTISVPVQVVQPVQPVQPVLQHGFGSLVQTITTHGATPKKQVQLQVPAQVPASLPGVFSARANNTHANNTQSSNDSGDEDNEFLFGAVNHVLNTGLAGSNNSTPYKTEQRVPLSSTSPFVATDDAMKALQTSGSKHALLGSARKKIFAAKPVSVPAAVAPALTAASVPAHRDPVVPFDPSSVDLSTLDWAQLVVASQANSRFNTNYNFQEDSTWVRAKPFGAWCANSNHARVLSMDCEMCETTDPVTGEKCENALVRFSVVDCTNNGEVLIDALVSPGLPITDARTHIHGITEEQLSTVTWTLRHAQAALLNLCSDRTVFVGHSLHKDLRALKFNHRNVVDTAYLFTLDGEPGAAPSLRDVSEQVLGTKLSDTHDSVEDARASMYAAAVLLVRGPQLPIIRRVGNVSVHASRDGATNGGAAAAAAGTSLLVHRIPDYCNEQHVQEMIVAYTQVMPAKVNPITRGAPSAGADSVPSGKTTIFFSSQIHCDLAFESIPGPNRPDKQNRDQKRVYFKSGGYICVRK